MPGTCHFQTSWLNHPDYKSWIQAGKMSTYAYCHLCRKDIDIKTMGESALRSHAKGQKHIDLIGSQEKKVCGINAFFKNSTSAKCAQSSLSASSTQVTRQSPGQSNLDKKVSDNDVLKAEIQWAIHTIDNHHSFNSNAGISDVFKQCFPDSEIAQKFSMGERKTSYLTTFGIAPYFKDQIIRNTKDEFIICFDESMHRRFQKKQMDVHIRVWDVNNVRTKYLTSEFLGHACASDLVQAFNNATNKLRLNEMLQISMDGPNVNHSFHESMNSQLKADFNCSLLNVGSCGIHKVHNAFQTAVHNSHWKLDAILKAMFKIFKDTPARRQDFTKACDSSAFPLQFCKHRWLENATVAMRAIECIENLQTYIKQVNEKKFTDPKTVSYETVKSAVKDPLLPAKLAFFASISKQVEPFLTQYQADEPLLPFLQEDLSQVAINILSRCLKQEVIDSLTTVGALNSLQVTKKENQLKVDDVGLGFSTNKIITKLKRNGKVSERDIKEFKGECLSILVSFSEKFLAKSPLQYSLTSYVSCLNPSKIIETEESKNEAVTKMEKICNVLVAKRGLRLMDGDVIINEFKDFISEGAKSGLFSSFKRYDGDNEKKEKKDRLDEFYYNKLANDKKKRHLWSVVRQLLLLSHGQATVERGFSVNKQVETCNMSEQAHVARRLVIDSIRRLGGASKVQINKELLVRASSAHNHYSNFLKEQKEKEATLSRGQKRKSAEDEIHELQTKKKALQMEYDLLINEADDLAKNSTKKGVDTRKVMIKSNSHRDSAKSKKEKIADIEKAIASQVELVKNMAA